jgi:hypothetical protein
LEKKGLNTRYCPKCQEIKLLDDYFKLTRSKQGVQGYCKACQKDMDKIARVRRKNNGPTIIRDSKECQACHNRKPIGQFGIRRDSADGHLSYCKPCWTEYVKKAKKKIK